MDELFRQGQIAIRGMWRYRRIGALTAWIVGMIGAIGVFLTPDKYEASAQIYVNTDSILKPLMAGLTVEPNVGQRLSMLSRVMISRPNVEKMVQRAGLATTAKSKEDGDKVVEDVLRVLDIKASGKDNLYTLTFRDRNPATAKRVMEVFTSMFIESGQGNKASDSDAAMKFIDEQIGIYEKKLADAENRLKEFKLKYLGLTPGEGKDYFARMTETNNLLSQAQLELREAENSRDALRRGLAGEEPTAGAGSSGAANSGESIVELDARIDSMQRNLDTLLQRYTDGHPDVVGARRMVRELQEQRRQLVANRKKDGVPLFQSAPGNGPRAYDQLKVALASAEANVASLRIRVAEYSSRYARLKESAKLMPQLEAEYAQLNRDYEVNKKNYESLIGRRESANISGEMQSVSGVADFRLIDPPRVSPRPVAPNRLLLLPLSLILAIVSGFAATYVLLLVRPSFFDGRDLREATGLPILGVVSLIVNEQMKLATRKSLIRFLSAIGALVGSYLVGLLALIFLTVRAT